ncbi:MAG TPA: EAL domain-containing protein [Bacillales bacterium]|nr:EAL domain-containing protein [Bacillales bacterium]
MKIKYVNRIGGNQGLRTKKIQANMEIMLKFLNKQYFEQEIYHSLKEGNFQFVYQPQYCLNTNNIIAGEALIRWNHPTFGQISPEHFIPLCEKFGLIIPLGEWVIEKACQQLQFWHSKGHKLKLCVNLSFGQLYQQNFIEMISKIIKKTKVDPAYLELELTETMTGNDTENFTSIIDDIRKLGIRVALDDFGVGYSSLSYLTFLNVDLIKIDKSIINKINESKKHRAVFVAIVALAKNLNLEVVVEGIETKEQMELIKNLGCNIMQGFYFSKPIRENEFENLLLRMNK